MTISRLPHTPRFHLAKDSTILEFSIGQQLSMENSHVSIAFLSYWRLSQVYISKVDLSVKYFGILSTIIESVLSAPSRLSGRLAGMVHNI